MDPDQSQPKRAIHSVGKFMRRLFLPDRADFIAWPACILLLIVILFLWKWLSPIITLYLLPREIRQVP